MTLEFVIKKWVDLEINKMLLEENNNIIYLYYDGDDFAQITINKVSNECMIHNDFLSSIRTLFKCDIHIIHNAIMYLLKKRFNSKSTKLLLTMSKEIMKIMYSKDNL